MSFGKKSNCPVRSEMFMKERNGFEGVRLKLSGPVFRNLLFHLKFKNAVLANGQWSWECDLIQTLGGGKCPR